MKTPYEFLRDLLEDINSRKILLMPGSECGAGARIEEMRAIVAAGEPPSGIEDEPSGEDQS